MRPIDAEQLEKYLRDAARKFKGDDLGTVSMRDGIVLAIRTLKYVNTLAAWQMEEWIKEKEHPTCQESRQVEERLNREVE